MGPEVIVINTVVPCHSWALLRASWRGIGELEFLLLLLIATAVFTADRLIRLSILVPKIPQNIEIFFNFLTFPRFLLMLLHYVEQYVFEPKFGDQNTAIIEVIHYFFFDV